MAGNKNINKRSLYHLALASVLTVLAWPVAAQAVDIETPKIGLTSVPVEIVVSGAEAGADVSLSVGDAVHHAMADDSGQAEFDDIVVEHTGSFAIRAETGGQSASAALRILPGWVSLMPAFVAIVVALAARNVVPALVLGLWLGATALQGFTLAGALKGLLDVFAVFIANAVADADHAAVILFTMMIGGMVGIITRNGGMASVVRFVVSRAKTAVGGQIAVWVMGLIIFFDDYANTLVVGNTARPITDHLKISREKLSYIVDSTAAPVVCIALITTWIGYQVSLIDQAMADIDGLAGRQAYAVFLHTIPYSFYPILAVIFVFAIAVMDRDIGPMYKAERRAREGQVSSWAAGALPAMHGDSLEPKDGVPLRAVNAFVPIIVLIGGLGVSMYVTGHGDTIRDIVGSSDPYKAMMWASFVGALVAAGMSIGQRILTAHETVDAWYGGARATLFGMIVLVLAWSMSSVTADMNAKGYLISVLGEALPVSLVPAVVFILAAVTSFATGTSWGTMGILVPLVIPLTWAVLTVHGYTGETELHVLYSSISCVLAGAVWGDHCSPISDTTVLSSLASGCDHIEHVRTQMPYALIVGTVAVLFGTIPCGFGVPPWVGIIVGAVLLVAILRYFGRRPDEHLRN